MITQDEIEQIEAECKEGFYHVSMVVIRLLAEIKEAKGRWVEFVSMMEPIVSLDEDCLCVDPPGEEQRDPGRRDKDDPSCHSQYCPVYLYAWAKAMADGTEPPQ